MTMDINQFLGSKIEEPVSDKAPQVPTGRFLARIKDLDGGAGIESWVTMPKAGSNQTSPRLEVPFVVVDETVMRQMGRTSPPTKSQSFFLNVDSANQLDTKNNPAFGQLLAALKIGGSTPGEIFSRLPGAGPLYITITPDKKNDEYTRVTKFEAA